YETRSNTSSRSIPVNERWGGFELGQAEAEIGKDILYQAVQQGFNDLLDILFKDKEDEAMQAQSSREVRKKYEKELQDYVFEHLGKVRSVPGDARDESDRPETRPRDLEVVDEAPTEPVPASTQPLNSQEAAPTNGDAPPAQDAHDPDDHIELMFG